MRIYPVNYQTNRYQPAFQSVARTVRDEQGRLKYRNTTNFFRNDLDWQKFTDFITEKYKMTDKVNVVCYACSDGSEPLSLLMLMKEKFPDGGKKFLPITAKDIDNTVIEFAKGDFINMDFHDETAINKFTGGKFRKYFVPPVPGFDIDPVLVKKQPELCKNINYFVADITKDILTVPRDNTIVFCKNFWPYLADNQQRWKLVSNIKSRLRKNCLVVIGDYDRVSDTHQMFLKAGFRRVANLANVYAAALVRHLIR